MLWTSLLTLVLLLLLSVVATAGAEEEAVVHREAKVNACWRRATSRGAGVFPDPHTQKCPAAKPELSEGLCYQKCRANRVGQGPLCWDDCKRTAHCKHSDLVFCCQTRETCRELMELVGREYPEALAKLAADVVLFPYNIVRLLEDFKRVIEDGEELALPHCSKAKKKKKMAKITLKRADKRFEI